MPSLVGAVAVVTGGSGYVGRRLIDSLVSQGCKEVRSVDVQKPSADFVDAHTRVKSFVVDIGSDDGALSRSLEGADVVFHLASYGMSGESWSDGGAATHTLEQTFFRARAHFVAVRLAFEFLRDLAHEKHKTNKH